MRIRWTLLALLVGASVGVWSEPTLAQLGVWVSQNNGQLLRTTTPSAVPAITVRQDGTGAVLELQGSDGVAVFSIAEDGTCSGAACGGGGGAPTNATYWVGAAHGSLSAEINLGALATALVINTAGTPSAYAGTTCTNQFARALSAVGAATCASIDTADIAANAVTLAKLATQGDDTILANISGGAAVPTAATLTAILDSILGTTQGTIMYRNATVWTTLGTGTNGHFLQTQGAGANIQWAAAAGGGDALVANPLSQFAATTSAQLAGVLTNETGTTLAVFSDSPVLSGVLDWGAATSLEMPNGAAPTVDAFGEFAGDNNLWAASRGAPVFFDGTAAVALIGALVSDTPTNGQFPMWNTGGTITWETVVTITDPNADQILFFDDSAGGVGLIDTLTGLTITGTTLAVDWTATKTLTNTTLDAEGTGNAITLSFPMTYDAAVCQDDVPSVGFNIPAAATAPVAACVSGTNVRFAVAQFDDDGAERQIQRHFRLPTDWTGAIDLVGKWRSADTSGSVVWQIQTACVADAETSDPAWNTAQAITDAAKGTTLQQNDFSQTGITTTGCAAGEEFYYKIFRDSDHASDNLATATNGIAELIQFTFIVRRAM